MSVFILMMQGLGGILRRAVFFTPFRKRPSKQETVRARIHVLLVRWTLRLINFLLLFERRLSGSHVFPLLVIVVSLTLATITRVDTMC
jgi:hypothetical protein